MAVERSSHYLSFTASTLGRMGVEVSAKHVFATGVALIFLPLDSALLSQTTIGCLLSRTADARSAEQQIRGVGGRAFTSIMTTIVGASAGSSAIRATPR